MISLDLVTIARGAEWAIIVYFFLANGFYAVQVGAAYAEMRYDLRVSKGREWTRLLGSETTPTISILAPAYNEEETVVESVRALLTLRYPSVEIVVVNDGSTDGTMERLHEAFDLQPTHRLADGPVRSAPVRRVWRSATHPDLVVIDKENGGKADALNCALMHARHELFCAIDSDTLLEPDALLRLVRPFIDDTGVVASGGTIRIVNGCRIEHGRVRRARMARRFLPAMQTVEYVRAFTIGRLGLNRLGGNIVISGAFGLFRRDEVLRANGYDKETVGEDMELVLRLRRQGMDEQGPHKVVFVAAPVAWTEVPEDLGALGRQRDRWLRGLAETLVRHRDAVFRARYGAMGLVVLPYFVLVELAAPVIEALGLVLTIAGLMTNAFSVPFALLFFLASYGLGYVTTLMAILLDEVSYRRHPDLPDLVLLPAVALVENLGYRQMTVYWRMRGFVRYLAGARDWGRMKRRGFSTEAERSADMER